LVTQAQAFALLEHHLANLRPLAPALASVVLVGSLSNGSFTGRPGSNIDLVHILRDGSGARQAVLDAIARTEQETERLLPLARCIYEQSQRKRPYPQDFPLTKENKDPAGAAHRNPAHEGIRTRALGRGFAGLDRRAHPRGHARYAGPFARF